jgi:hypothetical protein
VPPEIEEQKIFPGELHRLAHKIIQVKAACQTLNALM